MRKQNQEGGTNREKEKEGGHLLGKQITGEKGMFRQSRK